MSGSTEPHDITAEQAVLGSMMLSPAAIADVSEIVVATDFYRPAHQIVHDAITGMHARGVPPDPVSVANELRRAGQLGRGGLELLYLHTLYGAAVPPSAAHHARIVRDCADRRDLLAQAERLAQAAADPGTDPGAIRTRAVSALGERHRDQAHADGPHLAPVPAYPAEALCGPLAELVTAGRSAGLHSALVGGAGLAALATAAGMADLEVLPGTWTERPALWVALVAPRGAGKSPAQSYAYRQLRDLDAVEHEKYRHELDEWESIPRKERLGVARPEDPTRLIDDVTLEMSARWLGRGDGTGGVDVDELSGWLRRMGRYSSSGDGGERGRWLSLWSATPWRYQRVGSEIDIRVGRPVLSICGGIQPPLHHLLGGEEDGLRPRWLPHLAMLDTSLQPRGDGHAPAWDKTMSALYGARTGRTWHLSGAGKSAWNSARSRWKHDSESGTETASVSAALTKADVQAARIALVIAESLDPGRGGTVPLEAVAAAVAVTDYVIGCWRALPDREALTMSRRDETLHRGADTLIDWLESHGGRASRSQLQRACVAGARTPADMDALLARYDAEYPGSVRSGERLGARGPLTTVIYAPRRGVGAQSPESTPPNPANTVGAYSFPEERNRRTSEETAGSEAVESPAETVGTAYSFPADSYSPTVPDPAPTANGDDPDGSRAALSLVGDVLGAKVIDEWPEGSIGYSVNPDGGHAA